MDTRALAWRLSHPAHHHYGRHLAQWCTNGPIQTSTGCTYDPGVVLIPWPPVRWPGDYRSTPQLPALRTMQNLHTLFKVGRVLIFGTHRYFPLQTLSILVWKNNRCVPYTAAPSILCICKLESGAVGVKGILRLEVWTFFESWSTAIFRRGCAKKKQFKHWHQVALPYQLCGNNKHLYQSLVCWISALFCLVPTPGHIFCHYKSSPLVHILRTIFSSHVGVKGYENEFENILLLCWKKIISY